MSDGRHLLLKLLRETDMEIQGNTLVKGVNEFDTVIPEGVEIIGPNAFRECTRLTSVVFPSTLTSIGNMAFYECTRLTSVTFSSTLTSIGNGAFQKCTRLTSVTLPEGLTSIGRNAFSKCTRLTRVVFPSTMTSIGKDAFCECNGLTSVTFPEGLTSIGKAAFYKCTGLTSVVLPEGLTSIGNGGFYECTGLTSLSLPEGLTIIGESAFFGCTGLTSVELPSSLTRIGTDGFCWCTRLRVLVPPCQVYPGAFGLCLLVLNASGSNFPESDVVLDPRIIGLRQRLLALWSQNVRRQGRMRQAHRGYRVALDEVSEGYDMVQSNRERAEVLLIWRAIKQVLGQNMRFAPFLFRKIIAGGRRLVTMKSYLNQPKETKVFKRVLEDLGIAEPRRFRNWQGRLESQLRF